jgi:hypothetical protein
MYCSMTGPVLCKASFTCAGGPGDDLGVAVSGAGCCLDNPNALAYSPVGSEDCFACVGEFQHARPSQWIQNNHSSIIIICSCWIPECLILWG